MSQASARLFARLDALGIATTTLEHAPVFTVEESRALLGHLPGAHTKSLFLKDKKERLWLVVARDDRALDMKELARAIGAAKLSFGKPELLEQILGVKPGSVSPLALINDGARRVTLVLDAAIMAASVINFHPLRNDATTVIRPPDLRRFLADCGHARQELDLSGCERTPA